MKIYLSLILLIFYSCSSNNIAPLKPVKHVDIQRYMGKWYVIASIPTFIEKGAHNAIETYTWNAKEDRIDVGYTFNQGSFSGEMKSYPQKAFIYNRETNSEWRIQLFWPLKFAYLITDLAPDYSYTVVAVPDRENVWIMARTPTLPDTVYQNILDKLKEQLFDLKDLKKVPQQENSL
jgi:apolipoprotein D and lipocalin family protein